MFFCVPGFTLGGRGGPGSGGKGAGAGLTPVVRPLWPSLTPWVHADDNQQAPLCEKKVHVAQACNAPHFAQQASALSSVVGLVT